MGRVPLASPAHEVADNHGLAKHQKTKNQKTPPPPIRPRRTAEKGQEARPVRNSTIDIVTTVEPTRVVSFACPQSAAGVNGLPGVSALLPVPTVAVVEVPQRTSVRLRPSSRQWAALGRITAEGAGYGVGSDLVAGQPGQPGRGAARRPAAAPAAAQRTTSTARNARFTQSKQLHLMSRRDPCSWRPPV